MSEISLDKVKDLIITIGNCNNLKEGDKVIGANSVRELLAKLDDIEHYSTVFEKLIDDINSVILGVFQCEDGCHEYLLKLPAQCHTELFLTWLRKGCPRLQKVYKDTYEQYSACEWDDVLGVPDWSEEFLYRIKEKREIVFGASVGDVIRFSGVTVEGIIKRISDDHIWIDDVDDKYSLVLQRGIVPGFTFKTVEKRVRPV